MAFALTLHQHDRSQLTLARQHNSLHVPFVSSSCFLLSSSRLTLTLPFISLLRFLPLDIALHHPDQKRLSWIIVFLSFGSVRRQSSLLSDLLNTASLEVRARNLPLSRLINASILAALTLQSRISHAQRPHSPQSISSVPLTSPLATTLVQVIRPKSTCALVHGTSSWTYQFSAVQLFYQATASHQHIDRAALPSKPAKFIVCSCQHSLASPPSSSLCARSSSRFNTSFIYAYLH